MYKVEIVCIANNMVMYTLNGKGYITHEDNFWKTFSDSGLYHIVKINI